MTDATQSKTIAIIIVTAIIATISCSLLVNHQASALSSDDVSSFLERLLGRDAKQTKGNKAPQTTTQPTEINNADTAETTGYKGEPLEPVSLIDTSGLNVRYANSSPLDLTPVRNSTGDVLGQQTHSTLPLRSSDQGWEIFGVPWYLWVLGFGAIILSLTYAARSRKGDYEHALTN